MSIEQGNSDTSAKSSQSFKERNFILHANIGKIIIAIEATKKAMDAAASDVVRNEDKLNYLNSLKTDLEKRLDYLTLKPGQVAMPVGAAMTEVQKKAAEAQVRAYGIGHQFAAMGAAMLEEKREVERQRSALAAYDYEAGGVDDDSRFVAANVFVACLGVEYNNQKSAVDCLKSGYFKQFAVEKTANAEEK